MSCGHQYSKTGQMLTAAFCMGDVRKELPATMFGQGTRVQVDTKNLFLGNFILQEGSNVDGR